MTKTKAKRIGIFGGTFNPPHVGHLIVAQHVCEHLKLDRVYFVPSYISPHKRKGEEKLALHRSRMVRAAIRNNPVFATSDEELTRRGNSYTVDTLVAFHAQFPGSRLFLIIGADNYPEFHTWRNPLQILQLATLVVMNRADTKISVLKRSSRDKVRFVAVPKIDISSSQIRHIVRAGGSIRYLVPSEVEVYLQRHHLYR